MSAILETTNRLFLDDFRSPSDCVKYMHVTLGPDNLVYRDGYWTIVRTHEQFVKWITRHGLPDLISFDHDLGDEHYLLGNAKYTDWQAYYKDNKREMTGYDSAQWLIEYCLNWDKKLPLYIVHSMNTVGNENIRKLLDNFKKSQE